MARRSDSARTGVVRIRKRSTGGAIRRALGMLAFLPVASRVPIYARLMLALVVDDRTPASRKALLGGALAYVALGRDIVPDDVPVIGGLDDLVVVALAIDLFLEGVPGDLLDEKLDELGIERPAFDQDVAQLRRLMPGPIRRTIRQVPRALDAAGNAIQRTGVAPRLRRWIDKEGSLA
jgi:uncharacterized membrane protein YkvA (DUF1232 family)